MVGDIPDFEPGITSKQKQCKEWGVWLHCYSCLSETQPPKPCGEGRAKVTHPPLCFFSLVQRSRSVNRKMWRSLRAPSTSSTMKLSFSSCRCCGHSVYRGQVRVMGVEGRWGTGPLSQQEQGGDRLESALLWDLHSRCIYFQHVLVILFAC